MENSTVNKLSQWSLAALVVGSMVGAGIFSLPATFGRATGVLGAVIAWCIAGGGMLMLAFVFQTLAERKPDLDSGYSSMQRRVLVIISASLRPWAFGPEHVLVTSLILS